SKRDWSSDVCSSDLAELLGNVVAAFRTAVAALPKAARNRGYRRARDRRRQRQRFRRSEPGAQLRARERAAVSGPARLREYSRRQIGRASCRERGET